MYRCVLCRCALAAWYCMYHISMSCVQVYIGRMVAFFCVGVFFALIYVKARARTQEYALQRLWMMMWFVGVPASMGVSYNTPRVPAITRLECCG